MVVPKDKLPALLQIPLVLSNLSSLTFTFPYHQYYNNNIRYFYKTKAPLLKYYNPHLCLSLNFSTSSPPKLSVSSHSQKVTELPNTLSPSELLSELKALNI